MADNERKEVAREGPVREKTPQQLIADIHKMNRRYNTVITYPLDNINLSFLGLAIGGESGELQEAIKKIIRDGETFERWEHLQEEFIDTLFYMLMLADTCGFSIQDAWEKKIAKLYLRFEATPPTMSNANWMTVKALKGPNHEFNA